MKSSIVSICFCIWLLGFVLAAQDLWPVWFGTKPAFALALVACSVRKLPVLQYFLLAFIAGFATDALSAFPPGCAVSAVPIFATILRFLPPVAPAISTAVAAAVFEILYSTWGVSGQAPLVLRLPVAACLGAATGYLFTGLIPYLMQHAGLKTGARK